jgi:uncharacterized membrane protein YedE/YeeE
VLKNNKPENPMSEASSRPHIDLPVVTAVLAATLALSLFLQHAFDLRRALLFLVGMGLGFALMQGLFGFTGGWRRFIRERQGAGVRSQLLLLMLTSLLFFPLIGGLFPGIHASSALGQVGISVLVGAFLFGIGMQLGGGCGSGTLFTVGQGQVDMLLTLAFFIVGATIGSIHLPWWLSLSDMGTVSLIEKLGWLPALLLQLLVLAGLYRLVRRMELRRHGHLQVLSARTERGSFLEQLVYGPWPLWWAVIALAVFNLLTLLLAGYPWSITFAFGLWGTKIWSALGGDISGWSYWASGYPSQALNSSVLADTVSLMDFGIILGAMLAAALANKYAPAGKLSRTRVVSAVVGGLLLGYGARLAFGCNIGGLLAGIASGSLHGWLWLPAGFAGGIVGVKLRVWMKLDRPVGQ